MNRWVIRGLDMETGEAWDHKVHRLLPDALEQLAELRKARGRWQDNPIVYGLVRRVLQ